jgi:orotidine-5'-phosphate decarboxylase
MHNIDKLFHSVSYKGHVCVGLDTAINYLPESVISGSANAAQAILEYNISLIESTFQSCACYKVQIAYYEELGLAGLEVYAKTLAAIRKKGGIVIADIKRGDIADTAERYAKAHFNSDFEADFVTLSPYMGMDSIEPWFEFAKNKGKGAFVLMRTSNKGMRDFEYLALEKGNSSALPEIRRLYHAVGDKLALLASSLLGESGYGAFGAVVGCTEKEEAAQIRAMYPNLFFLIPGYGAQGGAAQDAALLLRQGNGGVVNASRSILKAWNEELQKSDKKLSGNKARDLSFCAEAAFNAAVKMRDAIQFASQSAVKEGIH